jgi:hypothetical protein
MRPAFLSTLAMFAAGIAVTTPAAAAPVGNQCRASAPAGKLLHNPNSAGRLVWTTPCGSSTNKRPPDPICTAIIGSPATGGFGKFISAVTSQCREKHFGSYFGLDGMTFGILDWTQANLPAVLQAYQRRSPEGFATNFGFLAPHIKAGLLDSAWACNANRQAELMCEPTFHAAFSTAIDTAEFRKAEMDVARLQYRERLARYASLGLKTEYGNTAVAVIANNLVGTPACRPAQLLRICKRDDENAAVECMLDQYVAYACRGSERGSKERAAAIRTTFRGAPRSTLIDPTAQAIEEAVPDWGKR